MDSCPFVNRIPTDSDATSDLCLPHAFAGKLNNSLAKLRLIFGWAAHFLFRGPHFLVL
jgi:hypothetical protein